MALKPIIAGQFYTTPAAATPVTPGGSSGQVQYNNAGAFGGISGWSTNGSTALTGGASTTLAIGGATIGSNNLAVTGTSLFTGNITQASGVTSLPAGSAAAPSLNFGTAGTGIYGASASTLGFAISGALALSVDGSSAWIRDNAGNLLFGSSADARISRTATARLRLSNASEDNFDLLQFGGTANTFPALKRSTTALQCRLADDSNYAPFAASAYSAGATAGVSAGPFTTITSITVVGGIVTALTGS